MLAVGFDPEFPERVDFANTARNKELLQARLKEKLRKDVTVQFEVAESVAPVMSRPSEAVPTTAAAQTRPTETAKKSPDDFTNDPLIKKALEIFKGTIVEVRK